MMQLTTIRIAWNRVLTLGVVLALMAALLLAAKPAHASTTFTVNSTEDHADALLTGDQCDTGYDLPGGGQVDECTLLAAIQQANYTAGADTVNFAIPGSGVHTIVPASQLPTITGPVTINGYSQPGAQPNTKAVGSDAVLNVELSGAEAMGADGLEIGASNSTVKGLVINNWNYAGVRVDGSGATGNRIVGNFIGTDASGANASGNEVGVRVYDGSYNAIGGTTPAARNVISGNTGGVSIGDGGVTKGNKVLGNYVGTDASGTKDLGNSSDGVGIEDGSGTTDTTVGGAAAAERNVISGNNGNGIGIYGGGNRIAGNFIGTDVTGTKDLGNAHNGIFIGGGAAFGNTVGGATSGERNVISGNNQSGVKIDGSLAGGNKVAGNYIGTDASGTQQLGNSYGVYLYEAPNNTIGGTTPAERNVISGNNGNGVYLEGSDATGNRIRGNYVGTDKNGTAPLGNYSPGILINGPSNNTIGGAQASAGNVISANGGANYEGVAIYGDNATGNRILSNSIFSNGALGIDLNADGPTANDPGDTDTGANGSQNKPVITSAKTGDGVTTVRGKLNSAPNKTFVVQFFSNPSGTDEGKVFIGQKSVTTDGSGNVTFAFSPAQKVGSGRTITATATDAAGNTSEFSAPRTVVAQ